GTLGHPEFESLLAWEDVSLGPLRPGTGAGGLLLNHGSLSVSLASASGIYGFTAFVEDIFGEPVIDARLTLEHAPLESLVVAGDDLPLPLTMTGEMEAAGPVDSLDLGGMVQVRGENVSGTVDVAGLLRGARSSRNPRLEVIVTSSDASVRGVGIPLTASVSASPDSVAVEDLRLGDYAHANAVIGLGETRRIAAGIVVSEARLSDALSIALGEAPSGVDGLLFASVSIRGTLDSPVAGAQVSIGNARMAGVEGLDLVADVELDGRDFELTDFAIRHLRRPVFTAGGGGRLDGPLELTLTGAGIPGPLLGGSSGTLFDAALGVGGTTDSPTFDGRVESFDQGAFLGVPFDTFVARLSGADGVIRVDQLVLERRGEYVATALGDIPLEAILGAESEGTISIDVTGNPVALLGELTGVGTGGEGSGNLRAVIVGNRESLTLASARLEARAERFRPVSLFPRLDDLEMSVNVADGAVISGRVRAESGGSAIELASTRGSVVDGRELEPLVIGGVDAGVLALSTDGRGVTANIPGLMLPDEVGRIALRGKGGAPEFLVGGPTDSPFIWGEIEFSDLSLTYPFLETDGEQVGDLLADAMWSVRMTAGRNLWYWRPDANLNVERGRSLDFAGRPSDHTLCVSGRVSSSKGTLTYLHSEFDVREVSVDFPAFCEQPRFQVEAETRVADGTVITLTVNTTEDIPVLGSSGVTLDESEIVLVSDSPDDNTPEKIMAKLQYGVSYDLLEAEEQAALERRRAVELLGTQIGLRVTRPLLSPVESRIRRALNLDLVRIDIDFVEHFLAEIDMWSAQEGTSQYTPFIANTRMTLGKYISRSFLLSYLGVLESYESDVGVQVLGLRSEVGIEYEVSRNTSLSMRIVYDPSISGWDRRISIENRFDF
ncbi:MAG: translocation/assembly module TamB domain-containing protein, partial [Candidatus Eisenbacteria bacterium]|nr:translocation/assembly module TamB domain-containing protein [Candidatus Eisenbacteria bacterium]